MGRSLLRIALVILVQLSTNNIMLSRVRKFLSKNKIPILGGFAALIGAWWLASALADESTIKLSSFIQAVKLNYVKQVVIQGSQIFFRSEQSDWYQTCAENYPIQQLYQLFKEKEIIFEMRDATLTKETIHLTIASFLSLFTVKFMMSDIQKSEISNTSIQPKIVDNNQFLKDFYGGEVIKVKLKEIIDFLKDSGKYQKMGARIRRGVIFYGPPGTGKTMLARALANEANCQFIRVVASEFQEMFVGVGAKRVRELFASARASVKGCIIFIDQIDALGSRLNHLRDSHETTTTINQFLSEMDGFSPTDKIIIVAATNRIDLVDSAILRSGRFDLKIHIDLPTLPERQGIFLTLLQTKCKNYEITDSTGKEIARRSEGWCGADFQTLINQSVYRAIRGNSQKVYQSHILSTLSEMQGRRR